MASTAPDARSRFLGHCNHDVGAPSLQHNWQGVIRRQRRNHRDVAQLSVSVTFATTMCYLHVAARRVSSGPNGANKRALVKAPDVAKGAKSAGSSPGTNHCKAKDLKVTQQCHGVVVQVARGPLSRGLAWWLAGLFLEGVLTPGLARSLASLRKSLR